MAKIASDFKERVTQAVSPNGPAKEEFERFLLELRQTLNPKVDKAEAIDLLAQQIITKPIFEALFENYSFVINNPISKALKSLIDVLVDQDLENDKEILARFYQSVKDEVAGLASPKARQELIATLYDNFFKISTPKTVAKLGIVYTPIEIVDFIVHSVAKTLQIEFGRDFSAKEVHVLDPFTGTGTFITRLIQTGLLGQGETLTRQYRHNLNANEIVPLAYYIASINIENAYHEAIGQEVVYQPFEGICLTDTFLLYEEERVDNFINNQLKTNSERAIAKNKAPIMVIIGNPPYSKGRRDANDNSKYQSYPKLNDRIKDTYGKFSAAQSLISLYDAYIKAFRWATDSLDANAEGVIAFVTNSGWIDAISTDGLRKCFEKDFSTIYVFNLRGNQRNIGDKSKREGGKIFGKGSMVGISITFLIKNSKFLGPTKIYYSEVGDYLTTKDKLSLIAGYHDIYNPDIRWNKITPNKAGDWLNQRSDLFNNLINIGNKSNKNNINTVFNSFYSLGIASGRDIWCYNSSRFSLSNNIKNIIDYYNEQRFLFSNKLTNNNKPNVSDFIDYDVKKISWSANLINNALKNKVIDFNSNKIVYSIYRPFFKQYLYFDSYLNERRYQIPRLFPSPKLHNHVICVTGVGVTNDFSCLITNIIPNLDLIGKTQCFPRYYYEPNANKLKTLSTEETDDYLQNDAITDYILNEFRAKYSYNVTKDHIFYYIYGLLHSKDYRKTFAANLKKSPPKIPLARSFYDFASFSIAGLTLADLHLNYEFVKPYESVQITGLEKGNLIVDKMTYGKLTNVTTSKTKIDKSTIHYNNDITITGIPLAVHDYVLNGRSALDWLVEKYQFTVDKASGLTNDPNEWGLERHDPRYILNLLLRIITVSLETLKIVDGLPRLNF
ncbi:MAG: N-6 DNA methylase [Deltaproteobacteria bacterium]|nr:N-6 DNA methylase [Deltaproteobacteria bacterium]